ncbi:GNAT family N-acetyltransferase [Comamonas sp. GB3 AK4-5]|uniref:GNAT family N-acetyltransferase n=1 Tax=Comamonas sp. GB3 AK4-5 TaxID=3231487 RepID=UPI00351E59CC
MKFPEPIYRYWKAPFIGTDLYRDSKLSVVVNPELEADERVTILHTVGDAHTAIALRPDVAQSLKATAIWDAGGPLSEAVVREGLQQIGIVMHGADNLFYLPDSARGAWVAETDADHVRSLHAGDAALFAEFERHVSQEDLDAALIDLDDWAVFGALGQDGRLLSIASTYPWGGVPLADIGVLTLESARGNGCAKQLLRAAARHAMARGYELQYRCQLDNKAFMALAQAAGLVLFGCWEISSPDSAAGMAQAAP